MEHLWKTTREKLLSGKNNFRNENDLLLPICNVCDIFFLCAASLCGYSNEAMVERRTGWEEKRKRKSFHYNAPTVPSVSPFKWRIAYWSKSTDLLFVLDCWVFLSMIKMPAICWTSRRPSNIPDKQILCGSCQMIFYGLRRFLISSPLLFLLRAAGWVKATEEWSVGWESEAERIMKLWWLNTKSPQ